MSMNRIWSDLKPYVINGVGGGVAIGLLLRILFEPYWWEGATDLCKEPPCIGPIANNFTLLMVGLVIATVATVINLWLNSFRKETPKAEEGK